jgi:hypothetical protein
MTVDLKDSATRCRECVTIRKKMKELGFDTLSQSHVIYDQMNTFIKGEQGLDGKLYIPEIEKHLVYKFVSRKGTDSTVTLVDPKKVK